MSIREYCSRVLQADGTEQEGNISIDRFISNTHMNKTLETFVALCMQYHIALLARRSGKLTVKTTKELLAECAALQDAAYKESIAGLSSLMNDKGAEWVDTSVRIDRLNHELKRKLKDLDMLKDMITNVYSDATLAEQFKKPSVFGKKNYVFIEEFSN
jgi:hypothetical protein